MLRIPVLLILVICAIPKTNAQDLPRDLGVEIGIFPTGKTNTITDVPGVRVGHLTKIEGGDIRTGVTAILPHADNIFQQKVPAAIYIGNGFGKLAGYSQVEELGNIESPIILTNTLNVAEGIQGGLDYLLTMEGNENVRSANIVVGETNDGYLNDIRGRHVTPTDVLTAINTASDQAVAQGNVGAGTGTICFGYKGGIGSASRKLPASLGGYTIGVLVQTNFGGVLEIAGVPIAKKLNKYPFREAINSADGSCMIVILTDAPVSERNLKRMAKRAMMGLAKTGGIASNGSGDYVIAASTAIENRIQYQSEEPYRPSYLRNDQMTPLFISTIEATEEAIINSLFAAETMDGQQNRTIESIPKERILEIMKQYGRLEP